MKILVTGSQGVLGRPLVAELRQRGHEVWGCDLSHAEDAGYVRADVAERRQLERAFEAGPDLVYHLAAEFGRLNGEDFTEQLWRTAMVGTRNVLELCRKHSARLVFASSSEIYGDCDAEVFSEVLPERQVLFHPNEYALSKWTNERQILAYTARHPEFEAMRLRFFNSYGPGEPYNEYRSVVAIFCGRALRNLPLPVYKNYWRSFMYVTDWTQTVANAVERFHPGEAINIGGAEFRSTEELAEIVAGHTGAEIDLIDEDRHNVRSKRASTAKAQALLGHNPKITLEQGVPKTLEWMEDADAQGHRNQAGDLRKIER